MRLTLQLTIISGLVFLSACSSSSVQTTAKIIRGLTGGDVPRKAFLDPSVKEALDHEMKVCMDGVEDDVELRTKCIQIAYAKVKAQKGLDKEIDLGGEVIVKQVDDDEVIDGTKNVNEDEQKSSDEKDSDSEGNDGQ